MLELQELGLGVRAGAPGRRCQPRPADLEAPVLRPQREVAGRADRRAGLLRGRSRMPGRALPRRALERRRPSMPATRRASAAGRSAASARCADRATPRRGRRRVAARAARAARSGLRASVSSIAPCVRDSTLEPCRSTSTRAWSARITSTSSSAATTRSITCPSCDATDVLKQISAFAVHGAAAKPSFGGGARRRLLRRRLRLRLTGPLHGSAVAAALRASSCEARSTRIDAGRPAPIRRAA